MIFNAFFVRFFSKFVVIQMTTVVQLVYKSVCLCVDTIVHVKESRHIAVYHRGRYYKMFIYDKGQLLKPCQIEM